MSLKIHQKGLLVFSIASALFMSSCSWDELELEAVPEAVSFSGDIQPMFDASCVAGCHNTGGIPPDLSSGNSYDDLFATSMIDTINPASSVLYVRMNETSSPMPPQGKLDQNTVNLVLGWIEQGALDN